MNVHVAYIPDEYPYGGALDFRYAHMRALFEYAEKCAASDELWTSASDAAAHATQVGFSVASDRLRCPASSPAPSAAEDSRSEPIPAADAIPQGRDPRWRDEQPVRRR
jgi:hypothetical protein